MPNGKGYSSDVNSNVPEIVRKSDGNTVLTVKAAGFTAGKPVGVYGYVTQDSGAFATFSVNTIIPDNAELKVSIPSGELNLEPKERVTVVTWVSEVWPSMLTAAEATASDTEAETASGTEVEAVWKIDEAAAEDWQAKVARWKPSGTGPAPYS